MTEETEAEKPIIHEPGIYFDLDADTRYHPDPAKGSTSIKALAVDPIEAQFDWLHGEDKDTDALIYGSAVHARLLEGRDALNAKFCHEFDKSTVDGALDTIPELKEWLQDKGWKVPSGAKKADLIEAVQKADPSQPIAAVIKERWEAANAGKTLLAPKRWAQVELAAQWAQRDPLLSAVMEDGTFKAGAPEVSVFYEDRGVRLKARFDRLLRHAIIDLKTFAPMFPGDLRQNALKTINRFNYLIQAADYIRAWHKAKELHKEGKVFGKEPYEGFLTECFDRDEPSWIWVMVKSKGAPQPLVIEWQAKFALARAADRVEQAIDDYIYYRDKFGEDADWIPSNAAWTPTDADLPAFYGE